MKRTLTLMTTALFATALSGAALAGGDYAKDKMTFNKLDTNDDGIVSMTEFKESKQDGYLADRDDQLTERLTDRWSDLDTNQDGNLDQSEFARFEPAMNADEKKWSKEDTHDDMDDHNDGY